MMKTKFSRDRITEFVKDLSREATQIIISVTGEKEKNESAETADPETNASTDNAEIETTETSEDVEE